LNKSEALAVMHEIYDTCRDSVIMNSVSLDATYMERLEKGYRILVKCDLDSKSRKTIEAILGKHKLAMKEENGYVHIF
jgi:hypothetical protein